MVDKLLFTVMVLLVFCTGAYAGNGQGKGSCIYCHTGTIPIGDGSSGCGGCHTNPPRSGAHQVHTDGGGALYGSDGNASFSSYRFNCGSCHPTSAGRHGDNLVEIELYNPAAVGLKSKNPSGAGSTGSGAATVCTNIYCHSAGQPGTYAATPAWGLTFGGNRCAGCHGFPPSYPNNAPKANSHLSHPYTCDACHSTTTANGSTISNHGSHVDGALQVYPRPTLYFSYDSASGGGSCSNISCHRGNGILPDPGSARWGTSLGCNGCHGDSGSLASNAHAKHVNPSTGRGYSCDVCHARTVSGNSVIVDTELHLNGVAEVAGGFSYLSTDKTCSSACHLAAAPRWSVPASGACGTCHAALSGTTNGAIATNAHTAHLFASYGPRLDGALAGSCAVCHLYPGESAASHVNGSVELAAGFSRNGTCSTCHRQNTDWAQGQLSCESCHSSAAGPLSVIGGITAPDKTLAASAGHGRTGIGQGCDSCHDRNGPHISAGAGARRLLPPLTGGLNSDCSFCHDDPLRVADASFRNMSTHFLGKGGGQAMTCATCHDVHGTANLAQIRSTIQGEPVTYTDRTNGLVDPVTNRGLCQVCHTQTAYYRAGEAEPAHPAANCLACHRHNAAGGAFRPNGSCDACHGYPPAPKRTAYPIAFGVMNRWSSARYENYSGGGGAHLVAQHVSPSARPSEGWANCAKCHNGGVTGAAPFHRMLTPVSAHISNVHIEVDPKLRFGDGFIAYSGARLVDRPGVNATGSCVNVSCHMGPSLRWSIER